MCLDFQRQTGKKAKFFSKKSYLSLRDRSTCSDLQFVLKSEHLNSLYLEPGNLHLHFFWAAIKHKTTRQTRVSKLTQMPKCRTKRLKRSFFITILIFNHISVFLCWPMFFLRSIFYTMNVFYYCNSLPCIAVRLDLGGNNNTLLLYFAMRIFLLIDRRPSQWRECYFKAA